MVYMPNLPAPLVLAGAVGGESVVGKSELSTVGFVRRVVDSHLPAGIGAVAAGPLVVLGLIFDAVTAAGALMLVPWLALSIYMIGLLRGRRLVLSE